MQKSDLLGLRNLNMLELENKFDLRNVRFKRNFFIYARYFQWFFKSFLLLTNLWRKKKCLIGKKPLQSSKVVFFFLTSKRFSFFNVIAHGLSFSLFGTRCIHLRWDPLFFFYTFKHIQANLSEFFPIFFVEPSLLRDTTFYHNFLLLFTKYPIFFLLNFNANSVRHELVLYKKTYAFFLPALYGFYLFLFWLRFIFKNF